MAGNPKGSKWRSAKQEMRTRKMVSVTLSNEAREKLEALSKSRMKPKSEVVESLIMEAEK